jgi:hypothetical protein
MGVFDIFKKGKKSKDFNEFTIPSLLSETDEMYFYDSYSDEAFEKIFISFINHSYSKNKKIKIMSYYYKITEILNIPNNNMQYLIRITKENNGIKIFIVYNLKAKVAYAIVCENNEMYLCSDNFINDIQVDLSFGFNGNPMNELIRDYGISHKGSSN